MTKHVGNWKHKLPDGWQVEMNGTARKVDGVPPFSAIITRNETPVAVLNPSVGIFLQFSEEAFLAACEAELSKIAARKARP